MAGVMDSIFGGGEKEHKEQQPAGRSEKAKEAAKSRYEAWKKANADLIKEREGK